MTNSRKPKKWSIVPIALLAVFIFSSIACQPTPDAPIVQSKNDGKLQAAIYGSAAPEAKYEAPEQWEESFQSDDGTVEVNVNSKITVPDVEKYPVYRVSNPVYTDDDVTAFVHAMVGDKKLYTVDTAWTKSAIEEEMRILEEETAPGSKMYNALQSGELSQDEYEYYVAQNNRNLEKLRAEYKTAPVDPTYKEVELKLASAQDAFEYFTNNEVVRARGLVKNDDGTVGYIDVITNNFYPYTTYQIKHYYSKGEEEMVTLPVPSEANFATTASIDCSAYDGKKYEMDMSYDEAEAFCEDIINNKLGYSNLSIARVCYQRYVQDYEELISDSISVRYLFIYMPVVDGIPMLHYTNDMKNADHEMLPETPRAVAIFVKDKDNYEVYEQSNTTLGDKLSENVPLLSFDNVKDIFKRYIVMNANHKPTLISDENSFEHDTINVTDVRLGYVRIIEKDNVESGILVPAWCFYGNESVKIKQEYSSQLALDENGELHADNDPGGAFLCINAIDGSVIDLDKGY